MAEQPGALLAGLVGTGAGVDALKIPLGHAQMPQAVEGHGTGGIRVLSIGTVDVNKSLKLFDGLMGLHAVRDKELFAPGRPLQMILEAGDQDGVQGHRPDQAALPLDGDRLLPDGPAGGSGVDAEALMDAEGSIAPQVEEGDDVLTARLQRVCQHTVKLRRAPGAVHPFQGPALKAQLLVARELVAGPVHQVVEKPDRGQVRLDGGWSLSAFLQVHHIGVDVLGGDVGQALQAVTVCQEAAEPLHGLVVPGAGLVAPLAVVAVEAVQLGEKIFILLRHSIVLS